MERTPVVMMMPCIAMIPIPITCPAVMYVPPTRVISPIPRTCPCIPCVAPEPIVYIGSIYIHRLDDVSRAIYIFIAYYLYRYIVGLVFLYIYRGYVLIDIFGQDSLQNNQALVTLSRLYNAQVIHLSVAIQIQITKCAVRIVEHRLELFQVLSLRKQLSYNLQIKPFRDVRTVGRYSYCLICP